MLLYASTTETLVDGIILLVFYSAGLGLPFFGAAMGIDRFLTSFKRVRGYLGVVTGMSGIFLVLFGLLVYHDALTMLTSLFERYGIGAYLGADGG
jgi:cytochrome c-type biogenesis protein